MIPRRGGGGGGGDGDSGVEEAEIAEETDLKREARSNGEGEKTL